MQSMWTWGVISIINSDLPLEAVAVIEMQDLIWQHLLRRADVGFLGASHQPNTELLSPVPGES